MDALRLLLKRDAERPNRHYHAERGNDLCDLRKLFWKSGEVNLPPTRVVLETAINSH